MGFRVDVDLHLCQGDAIREAEAPGYFRLPKQVELLNATSSEHDQALVEQAAWACSTQALSRKEQNG